MNEFELVTEAPLTLVQLAGRLHPAAIHLPIGAHVLLLLHEIAAYCDLKGFRDTAPWFVFATLLSYLPAVGTGWLRAAEFESETLNVILVHRNFMLLAFGLLLSVAGRRLITGRITVWYLTGLAASIVVLAYGADIGGKLVYGEDYFG